MYNFNSLAPCGANPLYSKCAKNVYAFQLTRPVWGEPDKRISSLLIAQISTHSPRVGRTLLLGCYYVVKVHFNSLAPCGANP